MNAKETIDLGGKAPRLLSFVTIVGTWISDGESRRAFRALRALFAVHWKNGSDPACTPDAFAHSIVCGWPWMRKFERESGWTPEAWLMRMIQVCVLDWQSRNWTALIRRWRREIMPSLDEQKTTR